MRVGTTTATRQIPVSELLARHRGEQLSPRPQWDEPDPCETTDVIPAVRDDYYLDEPYAATGYSEAYGYAEEPADAVRPFVGVSADTDQFPMPVVHRAEDEDQTLLAPIDVEAMDAERERLAAKAAATQVAPRDEAEATQLVVADTDTVERLACDDTPSREIYIRELLRREGRLPREQRRKQAPKIAAAAAGVAALCGAVAATIVHVQNADNNQNTASGNGVPLTVVDGGGPRGQALDAPLAPRGTEQVTPDNSGSTATDKPAAPPRVAPYVQKSQQAQNGGGATSSSATPTTTSNTPPPTTTSNNPSSSSNPAPSSPNNGNSTTPPSSSNNTAQSNTPPPSSSGSSGHDTGLLGGLLNPITGLLGG